MRYSLGMNTKLLPLTKKALKANASFWCGRIDGEYVVNLVVHGPVRCLLTGCGPSAEEALDALEKVLTLPPDWDAVVRKMVEELK